MTAHRSLALAQVLGAGRWALVVLLTVLWASVVVVPLGGGTVL
eukprot:COSAG02_NODE_2503_length_8671_cov_20.133108_10_plen_43_part_00